MGRYPMPPGAPDIPGLECSGTVVKCGEDVAAWRDGDQVCALMIGDGYGEYAAVPAVQCLPVPQGVNLIDAGGLPETFCTVWTNVFERMHLQPGETFLIQGGSSGIGVTAIQLAKAWGCKVLATAGSDAKCAACRDFGADVAINYRTQDFVAVGKEFTGGRGVDAILDMVGGDYIPRQIDLLAHEGRLCFVALMGGTKVAADFGAIQRKHPLSPARRSAHAAWHRRRRSSPRCARRSGQCGRKAGCGHSLTGSSHCARRPRRIG
jgi:NADPH2:quinone reductase